MVFGNSPSSISVTFTANKDKRIKAHVKINVIRSSFLSEVLSQKTCKSSVWFHFEAAYPKPAI